MRKFEYCKPISARAVPAGPDWIHEVKYDGYRGRVIRDGLEVKILSKSGLDWTWRFPWIAETALKMKQRRFVIDGEICVLDLQGISDFNALHSNKHNDEAQLYAFDLVVIEGDDLRELPLFDRKARLAKLLARHPEGMFVAPFERRRDWARPVRGRLPHGPRLKAPGTALPAADLRLSQGQEPAASGVSAGHG